MKFYITSSLLILMLFFSSCITYKRASTFSRCEFRINRVESIVLNGISVMGKTKLSELSLNDASVLLRSVVNGPLIMDMTILVDIKNPNKSKAAMNRIDWILLIDDIEMMTGSTIQRVIIPANNEVHTVPLNTTTNIKDLVSGKRASALIGFALNLAGVGRDPSRLTIKAKPFIKVGKRDLAYPGYISIRTDFFSGQE